MLYKVPVGTLTRESKTLRDLFAPTGKPVPTSDDNPFIVSEINDLPIDKRDFERLLKFVFFGYGTSRALAYKLSVGSYDFNRTANTFDTATECISILTAANASDLVDTQDRCQYILESYDELKNPKPRPCANHPFEPCDHEGADKELHELGDLDEDDDITIAGAGQNPQSIGEQMNKYHRQLQDRIRNLKGKLDNALDTIEEKDQQLADCKRAYDELHADYDTLNKSHGELKKKYDDLQNQLLKLSEQIASTSVSLTERSSSTIR